MRLLDAVTVLDEHLVRPVLGNKTAREADTQPWVEYAPSQRAQLLERVAVARDQARARLPEKATHHQVRRADRDAALDVLEDLGLIAKTIGGKPSARVARGDAVEAAPLEAVGTGVAVESRPEDESRSRPNPPQSRTRSGRPRISRSSSPRSVEPVESGKSEAFKSPVVPPEPAATTGEPEGASAPRPVSRAAEPLRDASKSDPICASPASIDAPRAPYARPMESRRCAPATTRALGVARAIEYRVCRAAGPVLDTGRGDASCPEFFPRGGVLEFNCDTGKKFVCITLLGVLIGDGTEENSCGPLYVTPVASRVDIVVGELSS